MADTAALSAVNFEEFLLPVNNCTMELEWFVFCVEVLVLCLVGLVALEMSIADTVV